MKMLYVRRLKCLKICVKMKNDEKIGGNPDPVRENILVVPV